jgi:hypothetical protein
MSTQPIDAPFTKGEITFGSRVAAAMWLLSGALLTALAVWTAGPHWAA